MDIMMNIIAASIPMAIAPSQPVLNIDL
jgi:hypothetical protein